MTGEQALKRAKAFARVAHSSDLRGTAYHEAGHAVAAP